MRSPLLARLRRARRLLASRLPAVFPQGVRVSQVPASLGQGRGQPGVCWRPWCPKGNAHRKVLSTGFLHQQLGAQPHSTAPIPSTNRPMMANKR